MALRTALSTVAALCRGRTLVQSVLHTLKALLWAMLLLLLIAGDTESRGLREPIAYSVAVHGRQHNL